ncbi:MAG: alpha/beta hydrolase [Actinomycetota bacterium]
MPKPAPLVYELSAMPELGAFFASSPWLAGAPRGNGNRVLVIPGFTAGDITTAPLRTALRVLGNRPSGWGLGANIGPDDNTVRLLQRRVDELVRRNRGPIDIVGWSLGGIIGRLISVYRPDDVRQVISMGSPIRVEDPHANLSDAVRIVAQMAGLQRGRRSHDLTSVPVPSTAIFSRQDGIVAPSACQQPEGPTAENIEVRGSHTGLAHNPSVVWAVADRLAWNGRDEWQPFVPPGCARRFYPGHADAEAS